MNALNFTTVQAQALDLKRKLALGDDCPPLTLLADTPDGLTTVASLAAGWHFKRRGRQDGGEQFAPSYAYRLKIAGDVGAPLKQSQYAKIKGSIYRLAKVYEPDSATLLWIIDLEKTGEQIA